MDLATSDGLDPDMNAAFQRYATVCEIQGGGLSTLQYSKPLFNDILRQTQPYRQENICHQRLMQESSLLCTVSAGELG